MKVDAPIGTVSAHAYTIPTDKPEADGTIAWNSTTLVVVEIIGGDRIGLGYTYAQRLVDRRTDRGQAGRRRRRSGRDGPGSRMARDAADGAQSRPRRTRGDRDFRGRYGAA